MGLGVRDILHQKAQVTYNLLQTLVEDCQIFDKVTVKKFQIPSRAQRMAIGEGQAQEEDEKKEEVKAEANE